MSIDLQAVARHVQCDPVRLRAALTLLEQGFHPSYLLDYRGDELGGVNPFALATLRNAMRAQQRLDQRRTEVRERLEQSAPGRADLLQQVAQARTIRELDHVARSGRSAGAHAPASLLAARVWSPLPGDPVELPALASAVLPDLTDAQRQAAIDSLEDTLSALAIDRNNLVRHGAHWLLGNAKIQIGSLQERADSHEDHDEHDEHDDGPMIAEEEADAGASAVAEELNAMGASETAGGPRPAEHGPPAEPSPSVSEPLTATGGAPIEAEAYPPSDGSPEPTVEPAITADGGADPSTSESVEGTIGRHAFGTAPRDSAAASAAESSGPAKGEAPKRLSPRQRRRRWLITLLKPLENKTLPLNRLSAFQLVMLGRAVRSNLVKVEWKYDASQLQKHFIKHAPAGRHPHAAVLAEAVERAAPRLATAAEQEAWQEQSDRAQGHLLEVLAHAIDQRLRRAPLPGLRILAIDANGNRTTASAIVAADGTVEHTEDLPCQLSGNVRQQLVVRLGELVHQHRVNTIVVSNGTARRACLVALRELLSQSTPGSLHWTLVDRNGADLFAGDLKAEHPWRPLPRRFRAAAWLARQVQSPAEALVELDLTKTRLAAYQRELNPTDLHDLLDDVFSAAAAAHGADVNATPVSWIARLPGGSRQLAEQLDAARQERLFNNREDLMQRLGDRLDGPSTQCLGYLRVYGGTEPLDATAIQPADYRLAERLLQGLGLPRPPESPHGYRAPIYRKPTAEPAPLPAGAAESAAELPTGSAALDSRSEESSSEATPAAGVATDTGEGSQWVALDRPPEATSGDLIEPSASAPADPPSSEDVNASASAGPPQSIADGPPTASAPEPVVERYRIDRPADERVRKLIKEWQIGGAKVEQIIDALTDPFRVQVRFGPPCALQSKVSVLSDLQPGELVNGVVVGVAEFGAFVELAPECSGLIHVSRLLPGFISDPHELLQVGDVVQAWVVSIDAARRRVALSLLSPEDERQLAEMRQQRFDDRRPPRDRDAGGQRSERSAPATGEPRRQDRSRAPSGAPTGQGGPPSGGGQSGRGQRRDQPPGGRGRGGEGRGRRTDPDSATRTVTVRVAKSNKPLEPISEAKQRGDEPLRSFNDLMQFYKLKQPDEPQEPRGGRPVPNAPESDAASAAGPERTVGEDPAGMGDE